jgi:hypothetical protein
VIAPGEHRLALPAPGHGGKLPQAGSTSDSSSPANARQATGSPRASAN